MLDFHNRQLVGGILTSTTMLKHRCHLFVKDDGPRILAVRKRIIIDGPNSQKLGSVCVCVFVCIWRFPKMGVPKNGCFIGETLAKMDDVGVHTA